MKRQMEGLAALQVYNDDNEESKVLYSEYDKIKNKEEDNETCPTQKELNQGLESFSPPLKKRKLDFPNLIEKIQRQKALSSLSSIQKFFKITSSERDLFESIDQKDLCCKLLEELKKENEDLILSFSIRKTLELILQSKEIVTSNWLEFFTQFLSYFSSISLIEHELPVQQYLVLINVFIQQFSKIKEGQEEVFLQEFENLEAKLISTLFSFFSQEVLGKFALLFSKFFLLLKTIFQFQENLFYQHIFSCCCSKLEESIDKFCNILINYHMDNSIVIFSIFDSFGHLKSFSPNSASILIKFILKFLFSFSKFSFQCKIIVPDSFLRRVVLVLLHIIDSILEFIQTTEEQANEWKELSSLEDCKNRFPVFSEIIDFFLLLDGGRIFSFQIIDQLFHIYEEEDDVLIDMMNSLLNIYIRTEKSKSCFKLISFLKYEKFLDLLHPHQIFQRVSSSLFRNDHLVMIDFLISNETIFLQYFLKYLKLILSNPESFITFIQLQINGSNNDNNDGEELVWMLSRLRDSVQRMSEKQLFPYNIKPLLQVLSQLHSQILVRFK